MTLRERIKKTIDAGNISHAYIFEGDFLSGKEELAKWFLREVSGIGSLENCPDYYELRASRGQGRTVSSVKDDDMEELQSNLKMKPAGERNMALIADADTMTVRAQNRFLKTLEEPSGGTVIVLLSENCENLLETIRSRCVIFRCYSEQQTKEAGNKERELIDAILERRTFHELKELMQSAVKTREDAYMLLDMLEHVYMDILTGKDSRTSLVSKKNGIEAIEKIEETRRALIGNASVKYAMRALTLKI